MKVPSQSLFEAPANSSRPTTWGYFESCLSSTIPPKSGCPEWMAPAPSPPRRALSLSLHVLHAARFRQDEPRRPTHETSTWTSLRPVKRAQFLSWVRRTPWSFHWISMRLPGNPGKQSSPWQGIQPVPSPSTSFQVKKAAASFTGVCMKSKSFPHLPRRSS